MRVQARSACAFGQLGYRGSKHGVFAAAPRYRMLTFRRPVRWQVSHEKFGAVEVLAFCAFDAKLQALQAWDAGYEEITHCKAAVEVSALQLEARTE